MASGVDEAAADEAAELRLQDAAVLSGDTVLQRLGVGADGLGSDAILSRRRVAGPNLIGVRRVKAWQVLGRQLRSALLLLLVVSATISFFVGDRTDAVIIGAIITLSIGLGFVNEYRAELAGEALHRQIRHQVVVRRDGRLQTIDAVDLVPGDLVRLSVGVVVPADLRVLHAESLECDESVLTGESLPAEKSSDPVAPGSGLADWSSCAFMGTVVQTGGGDTVVVATGSRTEFGRIAAGLSERQEETEFQVGLRHFSVLLAQVAAILTGSIFVINVALQRPLLESLLFSLAIAVGITPQLLPAVVTTSLATGSRRLAQKKVLVKRLVCIEDLGDIEVLLTDKTGTLTEGRISFERAIDPHGQASEETFRLGLICNEATIDNGEVVGGNALRRRVLAGGSCQSRGRLADWRQEARCHSIRSRAPDVDGPRRRLNAWSCDRHERGSGNGAEGLPSSCTRGQPDPGCRVCLWKSGRGRRQPTRAQLVSCHCC